MGYNFTSVGIQTEKWRLNDKMYKRYNALKAAIRQVLLIAVLCAGGLLFAVGLGAYDAIIDTSPKMKMIDVTPKGFSSFVYDAEGNQISKLVSTDSNRIPVTMDQIPENLKDAFVAIEDERYFIHNGIDPQGIIRAGWEGIKSGSFSQGASTITQQLIKNNVFAGWETESFADSVIRKVQEQHLAMLLEDYMSKEDILLNYMNTINLGHGTLGVQAAARRYLGKDVSKLTLSECACIACITQNPSRYDPIVFPENNNARRLVVLEKMLDLGMITSDEYAEAVNDHVYERIHENNAVSDEDDHVDSYFVDALVKQVKEDLIADGYTEQQAFMLMYSGGISIYATQDPRIQEICDRVVADDSLYPESTKYLVSCNVTVEERNGDITYLNSDSFRDFMRANSYGSELLMNSADKAEEAYGRFLDCLRANGYRITYEKLHIAPQPQVSLTICDQTNGHVLAMVGGRGDKTNNRTFNRATDSMRQPGSTFKIISTYVPALDAAGKTLASTQVDGPFTYENGKPVRNWWGNAYRGTMTYRDAIRDSANVVTVKTLTEIGVDLGFAYVQRMGISTLVDGVSVGDQVFTDNHQPLALGGLTYGVKNIELNAAYAAIANGGVYFEPKLYTKVLDHDGNVLLDNTADTGSQVIKKTTAWLITSAMQDVVKKGTARTVDMGEMAVAGKTGTTSDNVDEWFAGYTPYYTMTIWTGFDDNTRLRSSAELNLAKVLWKTVMTEVCADKEPAQFPMIDEIVKENVCSVSGKKAARGCPSRMEYVAADMVAEECSEKHVIKQTPAPAAGTTTQQSGDISSQMTKATANLQFAQQAYLQAQQTGNEQLIADTKRNLDAATAIYNALLPAYQAYLLNR